MPPANGCYDTSGNARGAHRGASEGQHWSGGNWSGSSPSSAIPDRKAPYAAVTGLMTPEMWPKGPSQMSNGPGSVSRARSRPPEVQRVGRPGDPPCPSVEDRRGYGPGLEGSFAHPSLHEEDTRIHRSTRIDRVDDAEQCTARISSRCKSHADGRSVADGCTDDRTAARPLCA